MEIQYLFLGGRAPKLPGVTHVKFVSYGENQAGGPDAVFWSATDQQRAAPLDYLINQAREAAWQEDVKTVLSRYKQAGHPITPFSQRWQQITPDQAVRPELAKFEVPDTATREDQATALITRDMRRSAAQIINRKTAFVFPAQWPDGIKELASALMAAAIRQVCERFRETAADQDLPWTFLSMKAPPGGQEPLGEFIRSLHHTMLGDTADVKIIDWRKKGGAILLSGPTGSGKSYAARLLATSIKPGSEPVEINLAAVSEGLMESRMRGYVPGTFTNESKKGRKGWFEEAAGGVLFLDEFQSVPAAAQVQLLDLLSAVSDDIRIAPVGSDKGRVSYKVKVILAINEDIATLLRDKRLRKDLYYRVRFIQTFPSLKERLAPGRDPHHRYLRGMLASYRWKSQASIEELCESAATLLSTQRCFFPVLDMETLDLLSHQEWEGNFRELERVAFDLFQEFDDGGHQIDGRLGRLQIEKALESGHLRASYNQPGETIDGMTAQKRGILDGIQKALRDSRFVISKTLKAQPYIRSRKTLRDYLHDNAEQLAEDVKTDSRMIQFLAPKNRRTIKASTDGF